jgi:hypothetical protein
MLRKKILVIFEAHISHLLKEKKEAQDFVEGGLPNLTKLRC